MAYDAARHKELLSSFAELSALRNTLFGLPAVMLLGHPEKNREDAKEREAAYTAIVRDAIQKIGLNWKEWEKAISEYIYEEQVSWKSLRSPSDKKNTRANKKTAARGHLHQLLQQVENPVRQELAAMPATLDKALTAITHSFEWNPTHNPQNGLCFPELLTLASTFVDLDLASQRAAVRNCLLSDEIPDPPDYWEDEWAIGWIRYAERYELRSSRAFIAGFGEYFENRLRELLSNIWDDTGPQFPAPTDMRRALYTAWVAAQSLNVRTHVTSVVREALRKVLTWQNIDGAWVIDNEKQERTPCQSTTAYAAIALASYGDADRWSQPLDKAIEWLLKNSNPDGGWGSGEYKGSVSSIDFLATIAVLDVCRTRGVPLDHPTISAAEAALFNAQHFSGIWMDCRGKAEEYLTCLIVRYFQRREQRTADMSEATSIGRGLLLKGHALSLRDAPTDSILALVSLYHGLEYTLYGFLLKHEISIRNNRGETIGCRDALGTFEQLAKRMHLIQQEASLPHKVQLIELAAKRDEVIHRMGRISHQEVEKYIQQVFGFINKFDFKVLGHSLLD
jgi:hypothetical protein